MKPNRVGFVEPVQQALTFSWDPRLSYKPGSVWEGTLAAMLQFSLQLRVQRVAHRFQQKGPDAEIVIEGGGTINPDQKEDIVDDWQILNGEAQKDILQSPAALALNTAVPGILGATVFDVQRQNQNLPSIINTGKPAPDGFAVPGPYSAQQIQLGTLLLSGETHFPSDTATLLHTQTVSDNYTGGGINRVTKPRAVYTTAQLLDECSKFPYPLPQVLIDSVNAIDQAADLAPAGYLQGWWKRITGQGTAANYKVQIKTEYLFDRYNTFCFTAF